MNSRQYRVKMLRKLIDQGELSEGDLAIALRANRFDIKTNKKRLYVVLEPSIADKLSPDTLAVYYWLKSMSGFECLDLSIKQISRMTGIKSDKKIRVALFILTQVGAIDVAKQNKVDSKTKRVRPDVSVITLKDEETAARLDKNLDYANKRSVYFGIYVPDKISDVIPRISSSGKKANL